MKRLPEDVGARLFRKRGRHLVLTEVGETVLRYARQMLDLNDELLQAARGASLAGSVRIGFTQDFAETILPQVLSRFSKLYPLVQVEVRIDRNAALVAGVESRQLDLALGLGHAEGPTAHAVGELPLVWIAGREFTPRDPLPLVLFEAQCMFRQRALAALDQKGLGWRIAAVSPSLAGLWAAAVAGLGVTVRGGLGLPAGLVAAPALFDLPRLGSVPVTLHTMAGKKPAAVARLRELVQDVAAQMLPAAVSRPTRPVGPTLIRDVG
jgi:DNA-binding transcriptional LysR family regulator